MSEHTPPGSIEQLYMCQFSLVIQSQSAIQFAVFFSFRVLTFALALSPSCALFFADFCLSFGLPFLCHFLVLLFHFSFISYERGQLFTYFFFHRSKFLQYFFRNFSLLRLVRSFFRNFLIFFPTFFVIFDHFQCFPFEIDAIFILFCRFFPHFFSFYKLLLNISSQNFCFCSRFLPQSVRFMPIGCVNRDAIESGIFIC